MLPPSCGRAPRSVRVPTRYMRWRNRSIPSHGASSAEAPLGCACPAYDMRKRPSGSEATPQGGDSCQKGLALRCADEKDAIGTLRLFEKKSEQAIRSLLRRGAGDRTRTGTVSPPVDFESTTSTNSITPAKLRLLYLIADTFARGNFLHTTTRKCSLETFFFSSAYPMGKHIR